MKCGPISEEQLRHIVLSGQKLAKALKQSIGDHC